MRRLVVFMIAGMEACGEVPARPWSSVDWLLLLSVLSISACLRLIYIDPVLSFDEIWHLATTQGRGSLIGSFDLNVVYHDVDSMTSLAHPGPIWGIWHDMPGVLHPPLFLIAMRLWRDVMGDGDFAAHCFSITWSLVAIAFTFATARLAMNRWAALLCGTTLACAQTQCYFAQEVRAYSMLIGFGSIALWLMTRCELLGVTRRRLLILAFLTLPMLLTHYFTFGSAVAIGLYGLVRGGAHRRAFLLMIGGCAAFYAVAWIPFALAQIKDFQVGDCLLKIPQRDLTFTTLMLAGTPFRLIADRDYTMERLTACTGGLFILPWLLMSRMRTLFPWVLWLCLSVGVIFVLDIVRTTQHAAYVRYLAAATPAVPLLIVGTFWPIRRSFAYMAGVGMSFGGLMYLISRNPIHFDAQPFPDTASVLARHMQPGEALISYESSPARMWRAPLLIMVASHEPGLFPRTVAILSKPATPEILKELNCSSFWLLSSYDFSTQQVVPGARVLQSFPGDEEMHIDHLAIDSPSGEVATPDSPRDSSGSAGAAAPVR